MKEDVVTSKPKTYVNKVGRLTYVGPKINQTTSILSYISTALCILLYSGVSTYV